MTNASSGPAQNADVGSETNPFSNPSVNPPRNQGQPSFYDLLGLRPTASVQDIRRAYRDLSKLYHPDTTELESAIATRKFQLLNEAYATLSSPEKRLTYDYKTGFSRISVMQSPQATQAETAEARANQAYSSNAYLDPNDRPLSAGEFFALFILGITFVCCLVLVVTLSLTRGNVDAVMSDLDPFSPPESTLNEPARAQSTAFPASSAASTTASPATTPQLTNPDLSSDLSPELPQVPWLMPKARLSPPSGSSAPAETLLEKLAPNLNPRP